MTSRKASLRAIASLCDEIGPGDGVDPRLTHGASSRKKKKEHQKNSQLCKQAEVAVQLALNGLGDERVEGLAVVAVEADLNATRLIILLGAAREGSSINEAEACEALATATGLLRAAVAAAIHRKRAPSLTFRFLPPREVPR